MADELLAACIAAWKRGSDFPMIWRAILRLHPLVNGPPLEVSDDARAWLEVPLTTGQRLAYHAEDGWRLLSRVAIAPR